MTGLLDAVLEAHGGLDLRWAKRALTIVEQRQGAGSVR
jgi:hypothetical protein